MLRNLSIPDYDKVSQEKTRPCKKLWYINHTGVAQLVEWWSPKP